MKKKNNRDDFSQKTINALRRRAGNRCSNPECRVPTDAPSEEGSEKVNSIGEAAHITAAAPGIGARRYNPALKPEERRSIYNGIWLCANCADKIDKDEETYTVALLHEWKKKAEESAKHEQGKKLPDEQDAVNTLVAAATGQTAVFLPNLVPNAIKATSSFLETVYPRFAVETNFVDGVTKYKLTHKEGIVDICIEDNFTSEFYDKYKNMMKRGDDFSLDISAVKIDVPPLLRQLTFGGKGKVNFFKLNKKDACIQISLQKKLGNNKRIYYELNGSASFGSDGVVINTLSIDKLISVSMRLSPKNDTEKIVAIEYGFEVNFNIWNSLDVKKLPQFDLIFDFYRKVIGKWMVNFSLNIDGVTICNFSDKKIIQHAYYQYNHLLFINAAKKISRHLKTEICYDSAFNYNEMFHKKILAASIAIEEKMHQEKFNGYVQLKFNTPISKETRFDGALKNSFTNEEVVIFNKKINLPNFSIIFTNLILSDICQRDKLVQVKLVAADNCNYIIMMEENSMGG